MNAAFRMGSAVTILLIGVALVAYAAGYYVCIHRHYWSIAAGVDCLNVEESTYAFFRPAIWVYELTSGREVAVNPMVHPVEPQ